MGLLYSWQLWRSGSLRVPLLCHAVHNGLIIIVFGQLSIR
jgi:membrane protease YdiL (CAAX protease family)